MVTYFDLVADFKFLWKQIKEDIQQWYERSDEYTSSLNVSATIQIDEGE
jgi:hypothetical protein